MNERKNLTMADKLRQLRKDYGMTQDDIAELLCMSRTSFSKYENGAANPPLSVLRKLSAIYNVPIEYLIHDESSQILTLHSANDNEIPDPDNPLKYFSQLTPEEKKLILKLRLMNKEKKNEFFKKVEYDEE